MFYSKIMTFILLTGSFFSVASMDRDRGNKPPIFKKVESNRWYQPDKQQQSEIGRTAIYCGLTGIVLFGAYIAYNYDLSSVPVATAAKTTLTVGTGFAAAGALTTYSQCAFENYKRKGNRNHLE